MAKHFPHVFFFRTGFPPPCQAAPGPAWKIEGKVVPWSSQKTMGFSTLGFGRSGQKKKQVRGKWITLAMLPPEVELVWWKPPGGGFAVWTSANRKTEVTPYRSLFLRQPTRHFPSLSPIHVHQNVKVKWVNCDVKPSFRVMTPNKNRLPKNQNKTPEPQRLRSALASRCVWSNCWVFIHKKREK